MAVQPEHIAWSEVAVETPFVFRTYFSVLYKGTFRGTEVMLKAPVQQTLTAGGFSESERLKFQEDMRFHVTLKHENLLPMLGWTTIPEHASCDFREVADYGTPFVVTPFRELGTLDKYIRRKRAEFNRGDSPMQGEFQRRLDLGFVLWQLLGIARGMSYISQRSTSTRAIHRDLKTSNILLHRSGGQYPTPQIMDFGLAKCFDRTQRTVSSCSTASMLAPECITGDECDPEYNHKADVFAFGHIIWELLTLHGPFIGRVTKNIEARLGRENAYWELYHQACKDPNTRPADLQALGVQLEAAIASARPPSLDEVPYRVPRYMQNEVYFELVNLMRNCHEHDPARRPSFDQIVESLRIRQQQLPQSCLWCPADKFKFIVKVAFLLQQDKLWDRVKGSLQRFKQELEHHCTDFQNWSFATLSTSIESILSSVHTSYNRSTVCDLLRACYNLSKHSFHQYGCDIVLIGCRAPITSIEDLRHVLGVHLSDFCDRVFQCTKSFPIDSLPTEALTALKGIDEIESYASLPETFLSSQASPAATPTRHPSPMHHPATTEAGPSGASGTSTEAAGAAQAPSGSNDNSNDTSTSPAAPSAIDAQPLWSTHAWVAEVLGEFVDEEAIAKYTEILLGKHYTHKELVAVLEVEDMEGIPRAHARMLVSKARN